CGRTTRASTLKLQQTEKRGSRSEIRRIQKSKRLCVAPVPARLAVWRIPWSPAGLCRRVAPSKYGLEHTTSGRTRKTHFPSVRRRSVCLHRRRESRHKCHLPEDRRDWSNPRSTGNVCRQARRRPTDRFECCPGAQSWWGEWESRHSKEPYTRAL